MPREAHLAGAVGDRMTESVSILGSRWPEGMRRTLASALVVLRKPKVRGAVLLAGHRLGVLALGVALAMGHELGHRDAVRRGGADLYRALAGTRLFGVAGAFLGPGLGFHAHRRLPFLVAPYLRPASAAWNSRATLTGIPAALPLGRQPWAMADIVLAYLVVREGIVVSPVIATAAAAARPSRWRPARHRLPRRP
jgi:hypothetical protein